MTRIMKRINIMTFYAKAVKATIALKICTYIKYF